VETVFENRSGGYCKKMTCEIMKKCYYLLVILTLLVAGGASRSYAQLSANSPCEGDTLFLRNATAGATYSWTGPSGFTSSLQNPFIFPATMADSAKFYSTTTVGGVNTRDSIMVMVHSKPVITVSNNSPLCKVANDTLRLAATPSVAGAYTWSWTGPGGFTSSLQNPKIGENGVAPYFWVGTYTVIATNTFGCTGTASTYGDTITRPQAPIVAYDTFCQGTVATPHRIFGLVPGAVVQWYGTSTGGSASAVPVIPVNTAVPGIYINFASQKVGGCESPRRPDTARVITTPRAPAVTGPNEYCQSIGPVVTLNVTPSPVTGSGVPQWYLTATGGTALLVEPLPNINIAGTYNYYVSIKDTGCEGPRTRATIIIHNKPNPPIVTPHKFCQVNDSSALVAIPDVASPSGAGDVLTWYGPNVDVTNPSTPPSPLGPFENFLLTGDTMVNWVTETSPFGCVSDPAYDTTIIKRKPQAPPAATINYCQHDKNVKPLNWLVDSLPQSYLTWYYDNFDTAGSVPVPVTDTLAGTYTWHVTQTVNGCQGYPGDVNVNILYKPVFDIQASSNWVCQYDSLLLAYHSNGPSLFQPGYTWTLSSGERFTSHTNRNDSLIIVEFDSATTNNYIHLTVTDFNGSCATDTFIRITVIAIPNMHALTKKDVCLGDTVALALSERADDAANFVWKIDSIPMTSSHALSIVSANSNTGGPFVISWQDTGRHIIRVYSTTQEGCQSYPTYDSVFVHGAPDATFAMTGTSHPVLCVEDSAQFAAHYINYNYSYEWTPAHDFNSINNPVIWGKMDKNDNVITLKVTDPYGCAATQSMNVKADGCCLMIFPNAFTPNGDGFNDIFQPAPGFTKFTPNDWGGYHRFHLFRIANRWGHTIFESANSLDAKWDGTYNGVPQDMGVYYWYVKYDCDGRTIEEKGDVTLIR